MRITLNHMAAPRARHADLVRIAHRAGLDGVELRNDRGGPLDDGAIAAARAAADEAGLPILGLSELYAFNAWDAERAEQADALIAQAVALGAKGIALIPRNDGEGGANGERQANLRVGMKEMKPRLEAAGLTGLIEPLGFTTSSLRRKEEAADAIESVGGPFGIIYDTFHHYVAGDDALAVPYLRMAHVSRVTDMDVAPEDMTDDIRDLPGEGDRLDSAGQLSALIAAGYDGPAGFEPFAPSVQDLDDPVPALRASAEWVRAQIAVPAE